MWSSFSRRFRKVNARASAVSPGCFPYFAARVTAWTAHFSSSVRCLAKFLQSEKSHMQASVEDSVLLTDDVQCALRQCCP